VAGLVWARLDVGLPSNLKIIRLVSMRNGRAALGVAVCAILWSVGNGTNGVIPEMALPHIHARKIDVTTLVEAGFWHPYPEGGWLIHDFDDYQFNTRAAALAAKKAADARWHPNA
jgi:hypothetical protein